jgi:hypothetical protein
MHTTGNSHRYFDQGLDDAIEIWLANRDKKKTGRRFTRMINNLKTLSVG